MERFDYFGGGRFFAVTKSQKYDIHNEDEYTKESLDYQPELVEEIIEPQYQETVAAEINFDALDEAESEPSINIEFHNGYIESNTEDDWPEPPQQDKEQDIERSDDEEKAIIEERLPMHKTDSALYTSFLTIDVSSAGKRDSLESCEDGGKHRASLLNLVTGSREADSVDELPQIDREDMDKIKNDLEMISKYLQNMPLGASYWPQNYDVLRDLVKLYLAAKNANSAALNFLLDYFLKLDWPGIFLKCTRKIMNSYPQVFLHSSDRKIPFEDPTPETLDMTQVSIEYAVAVIFQVILSLAAEFTEVHEESQKTGHRGFVHFIFQELFPKLHGIPWGKSTAREEFLHSGMDILYNFSQSATNTPSFYECNAVEVLINLRKETDYIGGNRVNIGALLTLSFLIDDRNNHFIFNDLAPISHLIHYIEESLSKIDHCYADFSLAELIDGLTRIASNDRNKLTICSHGGITVAAKVLKQTDDDEERISACHLIWSLCFVEKCKQRIVRRAPEVFDILRDLQYCSNNTLKKLAEALIWEFEEKFDDQGQPPESDIEHVMLSYHPDQRDIMLRISERLKEKGYKVWLAKSNSQSYPEHFMEAIENAAVVLVGISRKYKQTPSIFAEADYAFQLCKPMIPITLERNYKPDGWLGMLAGSKVWLDFTEKSRFEGHLQLLLRQIGERGKSERAVNILYINDHHRLENGRETPDNRLIDISRWGNEEVLDWLHKNNLRDCVADEKATKLRGSHLLRLHHLRKESPDFYYNSLEPHLGFTDVIDMMEFTQALEALTENDWQVT
eukprot:Seg2253.5 transcript_id=Seg2253.5/GoldUCD/mRNA.D3Y31 product="hypothetical protein" protein_id=Seg2253.5/GoldUCD/D3Y31